MRNLDTHLREMAETYSGYKNGLVTYENATHTLNMLGVKRNRLEALIGFLKEGFNGRYVFTLTFSRNITYKESINQFNKILRMVSKDYFRENKRRDYFRGYVVIEHQANGNPHFHALIEDHYIFKKRSIIFEEVLKSKCQRMRGFKFENGENKYSGKPTINIEKGFDFRDYFEGVWEEYVSKSYDGGNNMDFFQPLSYYGISVL